MPDETFPLDKVDTVYRSPKGNIRVAFHPCG
jgi:hypothetical protein